MYVPDVFRQDDERALFAHVSAHPFATVLTLAGPATRSGLEGHERAPPAEMTVSHLPLLLDAERRVLRGHLARENPQLADLEAGKEVLAIFHGPHGYVSPSVYVDPKPSVPTWNYAVVHVRGRARLVEGAELRSILDATVARFDGPRETSSWRLDERPEFLGQMLGAIAGFEIPIEVLEGKWKLSQNRSMEDRRAVATWLEGRDESSRALAQAMRACF